MKKAFTLVEIMIVVGIIALLAALSMPLMVRNRITTNEAVAISACKTIVSACQSYYAAHIPHSYPDTLAELAISGPDGPAYIDSTLGSGERSGYSFTYEATSLVSFKLNADPLFVGRTGERYFYTDESGIITGKKGGQAGPLDPPVE